MAWRTAWRRRWGGLLAALLLAVVVGGPALDAAICDDAAFAVSAGERQHADEARSSDGDPDCPADGCVCLNGHCHHGGFTLAAAPALSAPATPDAYLPPGRDRPLPSRPQPGPDRPPRA